MPNSNSEHSRSLRQATTRQWERDKIAAGYQRVAVLLSPEAVAALDRLAKIHGSRTAALEWLLKNKG